ncbi:flagellar biosynthesis regulator FlaF [Oceaniglobus ichthyenteri]|uniref:flagellar biosynthesis regulator FlaF n=1 Tax=Oceaniglobus ichthyenteri TaxID=2136177 RepID=UPI000D355A2A|nr:flagellar biosynthesis regulator FlaF [Oceaniglobus ichthyenteri]
MNAFQLAKTAYSPVATPLRSAQSNEYEAFAMVTRGLRNANTIPEIAKAIFDNRQLWTLLATDVVLPGNTLPAALRAQIFYLSEFTTVHSRKVLAGTATADALVDINSSIMAGLRQQGAAA